MRSLEAIRILALRHAESEGDIRRRLGAPATKPPDQDGLSEGGWQAAAAVGPRLGAMTFDGYFTSPSPRCTQTADALNLGANWKIEPLLGERKRGAVSGLTAKQHQDGYPESYDEMRHDPLHWLPPGGGESIAGVVTDRVRAFVASLRSSGVASALIVVHRDWEWAALGEIGGLGPEQQAGVNTNLIGNLTSIEFRIPQAEDAEPIEAPRLYGPDGRLIGPDAWIPINIVGAPS